MSQIQATITQSHHNSKFGQKLTQNIALSEEVEDSNLDSLENMFVSDEDEEDEDHAGKEINTSREWIRLVDEWIQMAADEDGENEENTILNEESFLDIDTDVDVDQSFANNVHPADDNSAKWNLSSLLVEELPTKF